MTTAQILKFPSKPARQKRPREYLTPPEVAALLAAARKVGRNRHRDATAILIAFRHGLRVSELTSLRWDDIDLTVGRIHIRRLKGGTPSVHPLRGPEIRALRKLQRTGPYVFVAESGGPLSADSVQRIVARAGRRAGFGWQVHPHMLRHATGFYLSAKGQDTRAIQAYLGHRSIQHTVRYTALSADRFNDFWTD